MTLYRKASMSALSRNYARAISIFLLVASISAADPADAPKSVPMTPREATECLTCASDLKDCQATDRVSFKWIPITAAVALVVGASIGAAAVWAARR